MNEPRVLRMDKTKQARIDELRRELHALGEDVRLDAETVSDAALARDRADYTNRETKFEDVLEREIRLLLTLPFKGEGSLWPKDRQSVIKAGVGLIAVRNKIGPQWGAGLGGSDEEGEE